MSKSKYLAALVAAPVIVYGICYVERPLPMPTLRIPAIVRFETLPMPALKDVRFHVMPIKPSDRRDIKNTGGVTYEQLPIKPKR